MGFLKRIAGAVKSGVRSFLAIGTHGPGPHNWKAGLKRAPVHLALFGAPSVLAVALIPPGPWKWIPAAVLVAQAIRGELDDVQHREDTPAKAIIDALTQAGPAIVAGLL
jgi:hypothetical protein